MGIFKIHHLEFILMNSNIYIQYKNIFMNVVVMPEDGCRAAAGM
jgi:hypothetical protein